MSRIEQRTRRGKTETEKKRKRQRQIMPILAIDEPQWIVELETSWTTSCAELGSRFHALCNHGRTGLNPEIPPMWGVWTNPLWRKEANKNIAPDYPLGLGWQVLVLEFRVPVWWHDELPMAVNCDIMILASWSTDNLWLYHLIAFHNFP